MSSRTPHPLHRRAPRLVGYVLAGTSLLAACGEPDLESVDLGETTEPLYVASDTIWPSANIDVCWETSGFATEKAWIRDALVRSWEAASAVRFRAWDACDAGEAGIHVKLHDAGGSAARLGDGLDGLDDGVKLNLWGSAGSPRSCATGFSREECVRSTAVHEFGHALGFAHEQNRPDAPPEWETDCVEQGSDGDTTVGNPDVGSVMNYCNPIRNGRGTLSTTDIAGVRQFYSGNVHQHRLDADGKVGAYVQLHQWTDGWSSTETFTTGGTTYLFLLKASTGDVHIHRMNADGTVGTQVRDYAWSAGWSTAEFFTLNGTPHLFLLKASTGDVHIHRMNADGSVGTKVADHVWSSGWTAARFYVAGGSTYLFLLKQGTGDVHVHRMNADGTVGTKTDDEVWTTGWSTAEPYVAGGTPFLLLLKASTGDVHVQRLDANGTIGARVDTRDWSSGWTTAMPYVRSGQPFLMLLKEDGGAMRLHRLDASGKIGALVDERDWTSGWTNVMPYTVGTTPFLFLLKE